jgi:hypothetical protein
MFGMLSQNFGLRVEVMQHHLGEKAETILYWFATAPTRVKGLVACFTSSITSKRRRRRETQQWVRELAPSARVPDKLNNFWCQPTLRPLWTSMKR